MLRRGHRLFGRADRGGLRRRVAHHVYVNVCFLVKQSALRLSPINEVDRRTR
jgi:hypothetical protein